MLIRFGIIIRFTELVENPLHTGPYNFDKANWERFRNLLRQFATTVLEQYYNWDDWSDEGLEFLAIEMQRCIQRAADESIPLKRQSMRSKPWWNEQLSQLKRIQACLLKRLRSGHVSEETYREALQNYHRELRKAQTGCWNEFLANARGAEVFRANGYCKQKQLGKLSSLQTESGQPAISFAEKCEVFLKGLFPEPPISAPI